MTRQVEGDAATVSDLGPTALGETLPDSPHAKPEPQPIDGPERGQLIGRFVVLDVLGTGGMGVVYAAYDPHLDRKVAIKLLRAQAMASEEARLRLLREAQAMARIDHPNVLRVHEAGTFGDQIYIAMEFAGGGTLRQWLASKKRSQREIIAVFVQAGRGLAAAHGAHLIHRDFKPDNVLLLADGVARVTDFGLVGVVGEQPPAHMAEMNQPISDTTPLSQDLTRTGALMGTPAYMSPEQFRGGLVGPAADQFAFCVALYEALYRVRPFAGVTFAEVCANVVSGEVSAAPRDSDVSSRVRRVLLNGLSTNPQKRYATMELLLAELGRDPRRRMRIAMVGGASVLVAGAATFFVAMRPNAAECSGAEARVATVWNPSRRAQLTQAFEATHRPDASSVLDRIVPLTDHWGDSWRQAYVGACEDTRVRRIQSEHLLDLRMACLTRRLDEARATLDVLVTGGGDAVDHALDAVRTLPAVESCTDPVAMAPPSIAAQSAVAAIRGKLDQARAQRKLGRYAAGLVIAKQALDDSRTAAYSPVTAEALLEVATLQSQLVDRATADTFAEAMHLGAATGDNEIAVRAAAGRIVALAAVPTRFAIADEIGALASSIAAHTPPSPEAAVELETAIGLVLANEGHLDQAQLRYDHALTVAQTQLGPDAPATLITLRRLGKLAARRHKYDDERKLFEQLLAAEQRVAGPAHPDVATALDNLANAYLEKDPHSPDAKPLRERALAIRIAALGPDHPQVAESYNNIGGIYAKAGDPIKARSYYEKALAVYRKVYGDDSIELTNPLMNLGDTLGAMGDRDAARALFEQARAIRERAYTPSDPRVAPILSELGLLAMDEKRYDDAVVLFKRAIEITEKAYGDNDSEATDFIGNLASTYTRMGKLSEAREQTARTLAAMTAFYGPDHPQVGSALGNYGFLQLKLEDFTGALASFQKADAIFEAKLGKNHPNVSYVLIGIGQSLVRLKRHDEAVPVLERAVAIATAAHVGPNQLAEMHFYLAIALAAKPANRARARAEATIAMNQYETAKDKDNAGKTKRWLKQH